MSTYLDSIIKLPSHNLEVFKRALCFDAQNDFFDLRTFVKDCVVNFDSNDQPIIEFSENTYDNIKKARMHKAVTVLFEQNYMSNRYSKWQENEELHKYLFEHAKTILASKVDAIFSEPTADGQKNDVILKNDMIKDFYGFLHRYGVFNYKGDEQKVVNGLNVRISRYAYSGEVPEDFPDKLGTLTAFEQRFIDNLKLHSQYVIALSNAFNNSNSDKLIRLENLLDTPSKFTKQLREDGFDVSTLDRYHKDYCKLKAKPPHPYPRETIESSTKDIMERTKNFKANLPQLVSQKLLKHFIRFNLQQDHLRNKSGLFIDSVDQVRNSFSDLNPIVTFKPDLSQQVLLVNNQIDRITAIRSVLEKHASTHHIVSFQEDSKNVHAKGLILVCIASPQDMEVSMTKLLKKMDDFFSNDRNMHVNPKNL